MEVFTEINKVEILMLCDYAIALKY